MSSKEKKRYHLTATSDGWSQTGTGPTADSQGRLSSSTPKKKELIPVRPRRR